MENGTTITIKRQGYTLSVDLMTKSVVSITKAKYTISVHQHVTAAGSTVAKRGTKGKVTAIHVPFSGIRTHDIVRVLFEGQSTSKPVKFEDLEN